MKVPNDMIYASFFFVDIVGLSNPIMSTVTQKEKITSLNKLIQSCPTYKKFSKEKMVISPTGDGMSIGFIDGMDEPIKLAIELHQVLSSHNNIKDTFEKILVRIGCHSGHVFLVEDITGKLSFWGPGIILARRVMDAGERNHILITADMAKILFEIDKSYQDIIHPLHDLEIKHEQTITIYSVHGKNFGSQDIPKGKYHENELTFESKSNLRKIQFEKMVYNLVLNENNILSHERVYRFKNKSEEPIFELIFDIITEQETKFHELDVHAYDEKRKELTITGIGADTPFRKSIIVELFQPSFINEKEKLVSLKYTEKYPVTQFENAFTINSKHLEIYFTYQTGRKLKNVNLEIKDNNSCVKNIECTTHKLSGITTTARWDMHDGVKPHDSFLLTWD